MDMDRQVVVVGYGSFPQSTSAERLYHVLALAVSVDVSRNTIVDASTTLVTRVADAYVSRLLVGTDLLHGDEAFIRTIERDYFGNAQKAIIAAFRDLARRYQEGLS